MGIDFEDKAKSLQRKNPAAAKVTGPQKIAQKISKNPWDEEDTPPAKPEKLDVPKLREQMKEIEKIPKPGGRKIPVSIRLAPETVEFFRIKVGRDWQTRINEILDAYVEGHKEPLK